MPTFRDRAKRATERMINRLGERVRIQRGGITETIHAVFESTHVDTDGFIGLQPSLVCKAVDGPFTAGDVVAVEGKEFTLVEPIEADADGQVRCALEARYA